MNTNVRKSFLRITAAHLTFTLLTLLPSRVFVTQFLPIHDVTLIKVHKTSPPFIAFEELSRVTSIEDATAGLQEIALSTILPGKTERPLFVTRLQLDEEVVRKEIEKFDFVAAVDSNASAPVSLDYFSELNHQQKVRLQLAQKEISVDEFKDENPETFTAKNNNLIKIQGPLEIFGGLAVTNDHHFEIRHKTEGVAKEVGSVNLKDGTYSIEVEDTQGSIFAGLYDSTGKLVGESTVRLSSIVGKSYDQKHIGPKASIKPQPVVGGQIASVQDRSGKNKGNMKIAATMFSGDEIIKIEKDGSFEAASISNGSTSMMQIESPGYVAFTKILFSGHEKNISLIPQSMNNAFLQIVLGNEYRGPEDMENYSLAWGKVELDGKNLSGVEVQIENDDSAKVVYFNELYLPDESLKKTSSLGLFAILSEREGLVSLMAQRGGSYFSHKNIVLKNGFMSDADIEGSIKTDSVPIRVFDAFNGSPVKADLEMQSLSETMELSSGAGVAQLPVLNRWSLLMVQPYSAEYIPALYSYFDNQSYIHLPLIKETWLRSLRASAHLDDSPYAGVAIGFVPDEDFEVFIAGKEDKGHPQLAYFDSRGRHISSDHGVFGGGFVIYDLEEGIHEIIVTGKTSGKIHSRIYSVDKKSVTISNFNNN